MKCIVVTEGLHAFIREQEVLRFPNPGSDINSFIRIFHTLFSNLQDTAPFTLDDMSEALIKNNLASSCGQMGVQALELSTREDRSRDPLYNQSKMYSELYRILGWIYPTEDDRLKFTFTYLGAHIAGAKLDPGPLVRQCILGITYPSEVLSIRSDINIRPFSCILRTMAELDGLLSKDEMIIGPLNVKDDRSDTGFTDMIKSIRAIRGSIQKVAC